MVATIKMNHRCVQHSCIEDTLHCAHILLNVLPKVAQLELWEEAGTVS